MMSGQSMRIFVAEDSPIYTDLLRQLLVEWGYDVLTCADGKEALDILTDDDAPNLAVLDWMLPSMDGVEVCKALRAQQRGRYTYIVLLTAKDSVQAIVEGLDAGADDYVVKPFDANELKVRLRAGRRILDLQTELTAARDRMRFQAMHDALTGLYNRGAILDTLYHELARSCRSNIPLSVVLCDLDHFKQVNDTHGHLAGDEVLREAALRLRRVLRPYDSVGRYGGEELVAVLPDCDVEQGALIAERARRELGDKPVLAVGTSIALTASFGVATAAGARSSAALTPAPDNLLSAADDALYRAKARGRNCVESAGLVDITSAVDPESSPGSS